MSPPDCEERLVEQCKKIKTINPDVKCFVYRNTELALEWLSSQRAVMNEAHAGFFLNFQVSQRHYAHLALPPQPFSPTSRSSEGVGSDGRLRTCGQGANASAQCAAAGPCTYKSNGGPAGRPAHKSGDFCCPFANVYW